MYVREISALYDKYICDLLSLFDAVLFVSYICSCIQIVIFLLWYLVLLLGVLTVSPWEPMVWGLAAQTADGNNKSASPSFFYLVPFIFIFIQ
jgi:hypothetical protein